MQVGKLDGHINPSSVGRLMFQGEMLKVALLIGFEAAIIALAVIKPIFVMYVCMSWEDLVSFVTFLYLTIAICVIRLLLEHQSRR